jgi:hypothetical protein
LSYSSSEGRRQLLDTLAQAAEALAAAISSLSEAYEQLDERSADALESDVFRPVQLAYGRARRAHAEFAGRHGLEQRSFEPAARAAPASHGVGGFVEAAIADVGRADATLATLQDSMLPVEVGDREVREEIAGVRELLAGVGARARAQMRTFGR